MIVFLLKPCLWCKNTPGQMPPEGITSHSDNYCSYYVLNITSFLFPSDGIYLCGWIKNIWTLYLNKILNLAPASFLARQLKSANNIYLFSPVTGGLGAGLGVGHSIVRIRHFVKYVLIAVRSGWNKH